MASTPSRGWHRFAPSLSTWALWLLTIVIATMYIQSMLNERIESNIAGCERTKENSVASARAWNAHVTYLTGVIAAASVKADVKAEATRAITIEATAANDLTSRLFECEPLIRDQEKIPDPSAIAQAKDIE